jgi:proteasome accessory factor C
LPPALEEALRSSRKLYLKYVDERGTRSERWISPIRVTAHNEYVLLRAFCHLREQERTFRLDRVLEMKIEGEG